MLWLSSLGHFISSISLCFYLLWSSSPSPRHNILLLVYSTPRDLLLLVYLPSQYQFAYPYHNRLFVSLISLCLSLLQSSSTFPVTCPYHLLLFLIPLLLLVAIIGVLLIVSSPPCGLLLLASSPLWYHFAYPCFNRLFASSVSLRLSVLQSSYPCTDCLLFVLIPLLLLVAIVGVLLLISSPFRDLLLLVSLPRRYHFAYPSHNHLLLVLIFFSLSGSSSPCPDSFDSPSCDFWRNG